MKSETNPERYTATNKIDAMAMIVSKLPLSTSRMDTPAERSSPTPGVPPAFTGVSQRGISPSRAIPKRMRGAIISDALIVLIAVISETMRIALLPKPPNIASAASAAGILDAASPFIERI